MALFTVPERANSRVLDSKLAKKSKVSKPITTSIRSGDGLLGRINEIKALVEKNLGQFKDEYLVIQDEQILHDYISACIDNKYISIDTETTGLDPLQDTLVGICIYTYGQKAAYIPLNHISYITGAKVDGQLSVDFVQKEFKRLLEKKPDIDMFNSCFDIRFLRSGCGLDNIYCTWDGFLAAKLLNENEPKAGLKALHQKYVLKGQGDAFSFDALFKGITFDKIPINVGYLYAAHDPIITTELCDFQRPFLNPNNRECIEHGLEDVAWVFHNIEMPCVQVVADMEDTGVDFDIKYQQELSVKYNKLLEEKMQTCKEILDSYANEIDNYRLKHLNCKLDNPINIASTQQLAIVLYDIMKIPPVDKKNPRGTGEDILSKIDNPLAKAVLEYRTLSKLVSTYIDKLPNCINPNDGRIHCKFNQYGAATGRFSSSDPNLQNIPSHNKDIRKMFKASDGYVLMSSDYSQQEPKCLAALCRAEGDSQMYDTFMAGKDLYSEIASKSFNMPYEDCLEFNPDGTTNKEGKERRTSAKSILLGVLYGRGEASIAEQLKTTKEKATQIKQSVFKGFPAIKKFEEESLDMAYELGYVTTVCGRKRRLPDYSLPEFEFEWKNGIAPDNDLLDFDFMDTNVSTEVPEKRIKYYTNKLRKCWGNQKREIIKEAEEEGILISDNGAKIAEAERQCVNARIQGSAADLTKLAMIELNNNERLKELGFRLLIPVHDEVIAECPEENIKECSKLLAETMSKAAEKILKMPIKCDVEITKNWYGGSINV